MDKKQRGSVSIFLSLILIPVIAFTGMFIDLSRIKMAEGYIASATDLALNSALAMSYDKTLKDVYGIFAISENKDELYENVENYYTQTIMSCGISSDIAQGLAVNYVKQIQGLSELEIPKGEAADVLGIEIPGIREESDPKYVDAKGVKDSGLDNPAILEKQIVEFMKYRGPIEMGESFIEALSIFNGLDQKNDIMDKKVKFNEAEGEINKKCKKLFEAIVAYQTHISNNDNFGNDRKKTLETCAVNYNNYIENTVYVGFIEDFNSIVKEGEIEIEEPDLPDPPSKPGDNATQAQKDSYEEKKEEYDEEVEKIKEDFKQENHDDWEDEYQYINDNFSEVREQLESALNDTHQPQFIYKYTNSDYQEHLVKLYKYGRQAGLSGEAALLINEDVFDHAQNLSDNGLSTYNSTDKAIEKTSEDIKFVVSSLDEANKLLDKIDKGVDGLVKSIDDLEKARLAWEGSVKNADRVDASFKESNKAEFVEASEKFKKEEIEGIKEFTSKLKVFHQAIMDSANAMKIDEEDEIKDITGIEDLAKIIKTFNVESVVSGYSWDSLPLKSSTISMLAGEVVKDKSENIQPKNLPDDKASTLYDSNKEEQDQDPKKKFITYLYGRFDVPEVDKKTSNDAKTSRKDYATSIDTNVPSKANPDPSTSTVGTFGEYGTLPSESYDEMKAMANSKPAIEDDEDSLTGTAGANALGGDNSDFLSQMFKGAGDLLVAGRDNLYVTQYAMSMFSYDTIEAELREKEGIKEGEKVELKTLTQEVINSENNVFYGKEVEYILFGNDNPNTNVTSTYAGIFAIRMTLNSVYAFTNSQIKLQTTPPAAAISAATMGFFPMPLVRITLELALALAETAYDIHNLKNGKKVAVVKTNETWVMSINGAKNVLKDEIKTAAEDMVDKAATKMQELVDGQIDDFETWVTENMDELEAELTGMVKQQAQEAVDYAFTAILAEVNDFAEELKTIEVGVSEEEIRTELSKIEANIIAEIEKQADEEPPIVISMKIKAVEFIMDMSEVNELVKLIAYPDTTIQTINTYFEDGKDGEDLVLYKSEVMKKIELNIESGIDTIIRNSGAQQVADTLEDQANLLNSKSHDEIENMKDDVINQINNTLDSAFKTEATPIIETKKTLFSFAYSDYLSLFLYISACAKGDATLARTADIMQINIGHQKGLDKGAYTLAQSATYVKVESLAEIKPLVVKIPFLNYAVTDSFTRDTKQLEDNNWYTIYYKQIGGY